MRLQFTAACATLALVLNFSLPPAEAAVINAPAAQVPIHNGVSHEVGSIALQEKRTINVVLPASYTKEPSRRYPVLYILDGGLNQDLLHIAGVVQLGAIWGRSAEAIVVGIETIDRRKELVGTTTDPTLRKRYPTAGSSGQFRDFIRSEVKPLVERLYRSNGRDAVLGESLAGLFVTETYLIEPELFDSYAAVDPSLWWDHEALAKDAAARLATGKHGQPFLIAVAKEQLETPAGSKRLVSLLSDRGLTYCVLARPDLTHATIYQQLTPQAVQYLLPPSEPPPREYGFDLNCSKAP